MGGLAITEEGPCYPSMAPPIPGVQVPQCGVWGIVPRRLQVQLAVTALSGCFVPCEATLCKVPPPHPKTLRGKGTYTVGWGCGLGWKARWCMKRRHVLHSSLPASCFFVLAGPHAGATLLCVVPIAKKRSKPRDNLGE